MMREEHGKIRKLDFPIRDNGEEPLLPQGSPSTSRRQSHASTMNQGGAFFESVAEDIRRRDRQKLVNNVIRYTSFTWAIINCLCAGGITAYSLYGHLFQSRLLYTQYQVNVVSIAAELGLYLPVPIFGYLCDRRGPAPLSLLSAIVFCLGYILAAFTYKHGPPPQAGGTGWPFGVMVFAFVLIGVGTCTMYFSAVTTCAKNFGRGKHKGFALAAPIACFGLGGMWQSQAGSRLLYEVNPDGTKGEVDVFRYFLFLAGLLLGAGLIGTMLLRIVGEDDLIDDAVEELERSGLLTDSEFYRSDYGAVTPGSFDGMTEDADSRRHRKLEERRKKTWLLNKETRRFLSDSTMWWLAAGFFFVTGPGEAFINNLGTIIGTLYPAPGEPGHGNLPTTTAATHVSIVALTSTVARILAGTLSDFFAPRYTPQQHNRGQNSLSSSVASLDPLLSSRLLDSPKGFQFSRLFLLLATTLLLSVGQVILASGTVQNYAATKFAIVTAFIGTGYGAAFSLVPIIISCVWGVENFGTNWGIVATVPAAGAAVWGAIYAAVYEHAAGGPGQCYGVQCYAITFWAMAGAVWLACLLWLWAWLGPGGWRARDILV